MMRYFLFISVLVCASLSGFAQTTNIKKLEEQRKQALQEISNTDKLLQSTKKTTSTLLNRIQLISNQINSRLEIVNLLNQEVAGINELQKDIESEIKVLEQDLAKQRASYAKAIDGILSNRQSQNKILFVLSGKSLSESYRRFQYLKEYSEWRKSQAEEIQKKNDELKVKESDLAKAKYEKVALLRQRERESENLRKEQENFKVEVNQAKAKQKELQSELAQKKKKADALNKQIEKLIAEEIAKENARTKAAVKSGKTQANAVRRQEIVKLSSNFAANKGKLPYPITGNYSIIGKFGNHYHKEWRVTTYSNGIDIQSQAGASARAVFNGEVSKVMAFPGYNNCVIIRHGEYYTFYANIKTVTVRQGDHVKTGDTIGTVYTNADTGVSLLHFQLWKVKTKLNPEPWLR